MEDNDIKLKSVFSNKSWKFMVVVVLVASVIMGILDTRLQKQYGAVRAAYEMMHEGQYKEAIIVFEEYLDSHTSLFWKIEKLVNGSDSELGYDKVTEAIEAYEKTVEEKCLGN